jgi:cell division protein FtsB
MRVLLVLGVVILLGMQVRLWFSDIGVFARHELRDRLAEQTRRNAELEERNRRLALQIAALKSGPAGVETRARSELGMIKDGETFYIVVDP